VLTPACSSSDSGGECAPSNCALPYGAVPFEDSGAPEDGSLVLADAQVGIADAGSGGDAATADRGGDAADAASGAGGDEGGGDAGGADGGANDAGTDGDAGS
jgi:hypothetical protein